MGHRLVAQSSYKDNYIDALRQELLYLIERELTPVAMKYGYSDVPLESKIKWKPMVLILGNYSSGKSTLINEFIGTKVQLTGQAPTDDSFTVITGCPAEELPDACDEGSVVEERDGKVLLNDPQYPFEILKKHGEKFAAHFKLKKVKSAALQNLAIIDTPGMLDSISEKDRGYDYQQVIGDLAQLADLVLVLFDPHKAGTVRESHASLRETLPEKTFEDRLIFVLNRIDECGNLEDLLRVYGTLCWNLSQMTGRKDIPRIMLTYAPSRYQQLDSERGEPKQFLQLLDNQREELQKAMLDAPRHRLDHLASFLEFHSSRLSHMLEAIYNYNKRKSGFYTKHSLLGLVVCLLIGALSGFYLDLVQPFGAMEDQFAMGAGLGVGLVFYVVWQIILYKYLFHWYHRNSFNDLDSLTKLDSQSRQDSWNQIKEPLRTYLQAKKKRATLGSLKREWDTMQKIYQKWAQEIRSAINELGSLRVEQRDFVLISEEEKSSS